VTSATGVPAPAGVPAVRRPGAPVPIPRVLIDVRTLPARRPALLRVVELVDSPRCSLRALADAAAGDPVFTARLLHLANSAYYGRSGRVTTIGGAVAVVGADAVRGLAVTMALGLSGEQGRLPEGFGERAAAAAVGSQLVAPSVGADPGDAFTVGLLHEVGQALMFRAAPREYAALLRSHDETTLAQAERGWCGTTSGELAEWALLDVGLPHTLCHTIAGLHRDAETGAAPGGPLARALRGGVLLGRAVATGEVDVTTVRALSALTAGALGEPSVRALVLRAAAQAAGLSAAMQ
jgi:HD-like signal output (HDOD) protein